MYFYKVSIMGHGTETEPYRPNIEEFISFVWSDKQCKDCLTCIMISDVFIEGLETIKDLELACLSRGLIYGDLLKWSVGDEE